MNPKIKTNLHPRNRHRNPYDFASLIIQFPALKSFVSENKYGDLSIDFFDPAAVRLLNSVLLHQHYGISNWIFPEGYLCPGVPGRADYIHYAADLLAEKNNGKIPKGKNILCLDIGVGASCIYPLIGHTEYGWQFIGSEVDRPALDSAIKIVASNPKLVDKIDLRFQENENQFFKGVIHEKEFIDISICNPPFYTSGKEAHQANQKKTKNLKGKQKVQVKTNFGGQANELWVAGGEQKFVSDMIHESKLYGTSCFWFTTLVSKEVMLKHYYKELRNVEAVEVKTIRMEQGNKVSRMLAWTFLNKKVQKIWAESRFNK